MNFHDIFLSSEYVQIGQIPQQLQPNADDHIQFTHMMRRNNKRNLYSSEWQGAEVMFMNCQD